jgi:PhnB protein
MARLSEPEQRGVNIMAKAATRAIPEGTHTVTPYLVIKDAAKAIDFYKEAFGAKEVMRMATPETKAIMHAEIKIGDSLVYMTDEHPQLQCFSPSHYKGTTVSLHIYVEDVDAAFKRAVASGATALMPPADMFWGDRFGKLQDPFGHQWSIATHKFDYTPEEMKANMAKAMEELKKHGGQC